MDRTRDRMIISGGEGISIKRKPVNSPRRLSENEIFFPRSRKAKIITTPPKTSGTGIHTFRYFALTIISDNLIWESNQIS